jgi:hypothetical protein
MAQGACVTPLQAMTNLLPVPFRIGTCQWSVMAIKEQAHRGSIRSSVVGFVFPVRGSEKVIQDKVCYVAAQPLSGGQVKAEMLSTEDPA